MPASRTGLSRRALLASTVLAAVPTLAHAAVAPGAVYRDPHAPIGARVRDLIGRMTLEEKVAQMRCIWMGKAKLLGSDGAFDSARAPAMMGQGIGQIAHPGDAMGTAHFMTDGYRSAEQTVDFVNTVQRYLVERTRLGIPAMFHNETAHGYVARGATIFPGPPGLASTWDPALVEQAFTVVAREARVRGVTLALSPVVDLARDPRYGRVEEFFGEDPYLTAQMGIAAVRGQQGRTRPLARDRIFTTLKHFVHGVPQGGLNTAPADLNERALRETSLVPFAAIVKAADPAVIMPSYNEVEGVPAHANRPLLEDTGRRLLGFKGAYFSDYSGIKRLVGDHHVAATPADAAVLAIDAGVQADLPDGESFAALPDLVRAGRVAEAKIDAAVAAVLALKFEAGLFERPYVDKALVARATNTPADIRLARRVAEKSLVLLRNDGILPLDPAKRMTLAVIGPNAAQPVLGGYTGENARSVSVLAGLRAGAGAHVTVEHAEGVRLVKPFAGMADAAHWPIIPVPPAENDALIAEAVELAKRADVVVLALGDQPAVTREAVREFLPGDRSTLNLFGRQDELVDAVLATGKPVIALLLNGRALAVTTLAAKARALVECWYPGEEGGNAIADMLFGRVNPGGKLAVSFPRSVGELPVYYDRHPSADTNIYIEGKRGALFPFGHGLSYTSFTVSAPRLSSARIGTGESVTVEVDVANTGSRAGDEVVQLYIRDDVSSVPRPILELRGFERVTLAPAQSRTLRFALTPDDLSFWDIDLRWRVEPGTFTISVGNSSTALKATTLTVA